MKIIDFIIGMTLMNAMPHFVLGVWGGRMFSAFGFGNRQNIAYGLLNFTVSICLFLYQYGANKLLENGIYSGAALLLLIYLLTGRLWFRLFRSKDGPKHR